VVEFGEERVISKAVNLGIKLLEFYQLSCKYDNQMVAKLYKCLREIKELFGCTNVALLACKGF
jgi:hypothetical protein